MSKPLLCLAALGLLVTGCAETAPPNFAYQPEGLRCLGLDEAMFRGGQARDSARLEAEADQAAARRGGKRNIRKAKKSRKVVRERNEDLADLEFRQSLGRC